MHNDKERAIYLRRLGKSYREIGKELGIPTSTVASWLSKEEWSKAMGERLKAQARQGARVRIGELNRTRGTRLKQMYEQAGREAEEEFGGLKYHPLFIGAVMLYAGEGDRSAKSQVRFSSADPEKVRLFARFLTQICGVEEGSLKASIFLYPGLETESAKRFWVFASGIAAQNFTRSIAAAAGRSRPRKLGYGVCSLVVSSAYLKEKMERWAKALPKELMSKD